MENKTPEVQNYENMSPRDARNYIKENADQQRNDFNQIPEKYRWIVKWMIAKAMREENQENPELQKAIEINRKNIESIRQYIEAKLGKDTITLEEWQQALEDFYGDRFLKLYVKYPYVWDFHEWLAWVKKNWRYWYINKSWEMVINCEYDDVIRFLDRFFLTKKWDHRILFDLEWNIAAEKTII